MSQEAKPVKSRYYSVNFTHRLMRPLAMGKIMAPFSRKKEEPGDVLKKLEVQAHLLLWLLQSTKGGIPHENVSTIQKLGVLSHLQSQCLGGRSRRVKTMPDMSLRPARLPEALSQHNKQTNKQAKSKQQREQTPRR